MVGTILYFIPINIENVGTVPTLSSNRDALTRTDIGSTVSQGVIGTLFNLNRQFALRLAAVGIFYRYAQGISAHGKSKIRRVSRIDIPCTGIYYSIGSIQQFKEVRDSTCGGIFLRGARANFATSTQSGSSFCYNNCQTGWCTFTSMSVVGIGNNHTVFSCIASFRI